MEDIRELRRRRAAAPRLIDIGDAPWRAVDLDGVELSDVLNRALGRACLTGATGVGAALPYGTPLPRLHRPHSGAVGLAPSASTPAKVMRRRTELKQDVLATKQKGLASKRVTFGPSRHQPRS